MGAPEEPPQRSEGELTAAETADLEASPGTDKGNPNIAGFGRCDQGGLRSIGALAAAEQAENEARIRGWLLDGEDEEKGGEGAAAES